MNIQQYIHSLTDEEFEQLCTEYLLSLIHISIGRIERGERNPSLEIAIRLAHYLKVPVEDILDVYKRQFLGNAFSCFNLITFCTFSNNSALTIAYTLSLHDALPISTGTFR